MLITVNLPRHQWYATQYCAGEVTILRRTEKDSTEKAQEVFTVALGDKGWNLSPDGKGIIIK
jgi:hypothetical protein